MDMAKHLFLFLALGLSGQSEAFCGPTHWQLAHDDADAVVLARYLTSMKRPGDLNGDSFVDTYLEVVKSWKWESSLFGLLKVSEKEGKNAQLYKPYGTLFLLNLKEKDGQFQVAPCPGYLRLREFDPSPAADRERMAALFMEHLHRLEKMSACACQNLRKKGRYDHADAIVRADVTRITEADGKKYAELVVRESWKVEFPASITVQTDDGRDCGFPVQEGRTSRSYHLYLHREKDGQFSTDFCSGNLAPYEYNETIFGSGPDMQWLYELEKPKGPKETDG
jgi:hypothetical protein